MNQFRDLAILALLGLAVGLGFGKPEDWTWAAAVPYASETVTYLAQCRPWSILILCALALALFMTRLKY